MTETNTEHSQMLAFIAKATFSKPEELEPLKAFVTQQTARYGQPHCGHCGHVWAECVGAEGCP